MYFLLFLFLIILSLIVLKSFKKMFISPWFLTCGIFLFGAAVSNLRLVGEIIPVWNNKTHFIVLIGALSLFIGSFTLKYSKAEIPNNFLEQKYRKITIVMMFVLVITIVIIANALEFLLAKEIPIFTNDPEESRFRIAKYGYLHVFSVVSIVTAAVSGFLLLCDNRNRRMKLFLLSVSAISFLIIILWVSRGLLITPAFFIMSVYYLKNKGTIKIKKLLFLLLIIFMVLGGIKTFRGYREFGNDYIKKQSSIIKSDIIGAANVYLTIALNYEILNRYVLNVPNKVGHTNGIIYANKLLSFLPGEQINEKDVQSRIFSKIREDTNLTSTIFGVAYLDFGILGVIIIGFLTGYLYKYFWIQLFKKKTIFEVFIYSYLITRSIFIPYTNPFIEVSFFLFISVGYLLLFSSISVFKKSGVIKYKLNRF